MEKPRRAAVERGAPAGRRAGVLQDCRKRSADHEVAGATGCGQQERAAGPRGGTSADRRDRAAPQPRRISGSRVAALTCPALRRHQLPTPGARSTAQTTTTVQLRRPHPASLRHLPPAPRGATPARRPLLWPVPPPPPHRPTEHARATAAAAAVAAPARARASPAGLPAALAPPRAPLEPIPEPAKAATALRDGQGRESGGSAGK